MSDSLDLGRLADNLPSSSGHGARAMQAAEAELQSAFRNSALCITQMLKAGQKSSKRAYQAGYTTALQDVLEYLQSSLDINVDQPRSNEDIAQVIDYIEARQQAAGLELQDIDAEDEQHQSTQQQHSSHAQTSAQASPAAPQRMQHQQSLHSHHHHNPLSFRNHRQQGQQQQLGETGNVTPSSSSFRGLYQQQHHQGSIASTSSNAAGGASTSSSRSAAEQRKLPQQRPTGRSLSPASNARQQSTISSSAATSYNTSQQLDGSNGASRSNTRARSQIDPEATQDSVALASSSSIPNSPIERHASNAHNNNNNNQTRVGSIDMLSTDRARQTTPPPPSSTIDPSLSTASTAVTPMTRLQAKREREKGRRNRSHRVHHDSSSTSTQASTANVHAGLKRRWTASLLPEQHTISLSMNLGNTPIASDYNVNLVSDDDQREDEDDEDVDDDGDLNAREGDDIDSQDQLPLHGSPAQRKITLSTDDDSGMEMDETSNYRFDGNMRPAKRLARR